MLTIAHQTPLDLALWRAREEARRLYRVLEPRIAQYLELWRGAEPYTGFIPRLTHLEHMRERRVLEAWALQERRLGFGVSREPVVSAIRREALPLEATGGTTVQRK